MPFSQNIHMAFPFDEQVPASPFQRAGLAPSVPPYLPTTPLYTGNFFQNQGSLPVPHLRSVSWGSPSQADPEHIPNYPPTGSRPSVFRGDLIGEEGTPFGGRTLPPLILPYGPPYLDVHPSSNAGHIYSRERTSDSGNVSTSSPAPNGSRLTNFSGGKYM